MRLLVLFFLFLASIAQAQYFGEEHWHQGAAILESGDTLRGLMQYNTDTETLQIKNDASVQTLSARKLLAFQFPDKTLGIERLFYVLPYSKKAGYQVPIFFELLERGDAVSLLQREVLVIRTVSNRFGNPMNPIYTPLPTQQIRSVEPRFYFFYQNGKIKQFSGSKKDLSLVLPNYGAAMKKYIKDKNLNPKKIEDLIRIIRYYNEINK